MKKSCQVYNLLFCKGDALTGCTISIATRLFSTILVRTFGA
ncbi:reductase [Kosakonia radicincitans]|nr:reductase [Kosakonia sp. MH5]PTA93342.1 reductase [Kosakonia sp. H7A]QEM92395.1 reductase [Kosakonia radicincitans]